jgi:translation initiation factor 2 beta subunit (eIF-2beta)/eIF-5
MHPLPRTPTEWLTEIADAYADAYEALPLMPLVGSDPDESVLFHLAPQVAIKFRGLSDQQLPGATEAALSSYVASKEQVGLALDRPHIAFAFCYLAAQFGLGIVSEQTINEVMTLIEDDDAILARAITPRTQSCQKIERQILVFKVALKGQKRIWRTIAIRGDQTLTNLHHAIFKAFDRDDEHLYSFYFSTKPTSTSRNRLDNAIRFGCSYSETELKTDLARIDGLKIPIKGQFEYRFDYGDEWWHEITLVEMHKPQAGQTYPCVVASKGESPSQYDDGEDY